VFGISAGGESISGGGGDDIELRRGNIGLTREIFHHLVEFGGLLAADWLGLVSGQSNAIGEVPRTDISNGGDY